MSDTQLATLATQQPGTMAVYDRIDPMKFIEEFGKVFYITTAGGAKTPEQGKLLALACLCERKTIFEISREFHLMDGKLSMRADAMLARFNERGGKHRWIKTGDDGIEAVLELTYDGQTVVSKYSMEDAKLADLLQTDPKKKPGAWEKSPRTMLRARCSSEGVRMIMPGVVAGFYTPEENEDVAADNAKPTPTAAAATAETAAAVKKRGKELRGETAPATTPTTQEPAAMTPDPAKPDEVIDAEFTITPDAKAEPVTEPAAVAADPVPATAVAASPAPSAADCTAPGSSTIETLMEIENLLKRAGSSVATIVTQLAKKDPAITSLDRLSEESALKLLRNLETRVNAEKK